MSRGRQLRSQGGRMVHIKPLFATAETVRKGKHLDPEAVKRADDWRRKRLQELEDKPAESLTFKERHQLRELRMWKGEQQEEVT